MLIAICDDESVFRDEIESCLNDYHIREKAEMEYEIFHSGLELLKQDVSKYDLCILDIEMPHIGGMELAKKIQESNTDCKIVFLSSHDEFVQDGYKVNAFRFLYKPVSYHEIEEVLHSTQRMLLNDYGITLFENQPKTIFIRFRDMTMIEALGDDTAIYSKNPPPYIERKSMNRVEKMLDERFFRIHKSFIINMDEVEEIDYPKLTILMKNGLKVVLARRKKKQVKEAYIAHLKKRAGWI